MSDQGLVERSVELEHNLVEATGADLLNSSPIDLRKRIVLAAAKVAIEHGQSARRLLLVEVAPNSGVVLVRAQYEALVRSVWLLFCSTDAEMARLTATLDASSEQSAKNMAGLLDMLAEVQQRAPTALSQQLVAFRDAQWKSLNSFVHAGIHPLSRTTGGFPKDLAFNIAKVSNALTHMAYRVCASLEGNERLAATSGIYLEFRDCFPPMDGTPTS